MSISAALPALLLLASIASPAEKRDEQAIQTALPDGSAGFLYQNNKGDWDQRAVQRVLGYRQRGRCFAYVDLERFRTAGYPYSPALLLDWTRVASVSVTANVIELGTGPDHGPQFPVRFLLATTQVAEAVARHADRLRTGCAGKAHWRP